ncbi:MAG: site-specific DNA-methyltransferase [Pseudonocardiaceae bacterium]
MARDGSGPDVALSDLTREELIALVESHQEHGIRISFSGKDNARSLSRRVRPRILREVKRYGAGGEDHRANNVLIEGDNLQAMATLYKLRGRVDMIVTDPPYNTGNDWRYNDKWEDDPNDPGIGEFVSADDGARHTKWMRFMYPRLQMMKSMLRPGGVLAICIDHRELFRLGQLLDEIFKQENRLAVINWEKSYSPRSDKTHVSAATEYVLVYAKDESRARTGLLPRTDEMDARYRSPDGDSLLWKGADASGGKGGLNQPMIYAIQSPFTGELFYPPAGNCWRTAQRTLLKWLQEWGMPYQLKKLNDDARRAAVIGVGPEEIAPARGLVVTGSLADARKAAQLVLDAGVWPQIFFGQDGQGRPQLKRYLEHVKQGKVVTTWWADDDYDQPLTLGSVSWPHEQSGHTQTGVDELDAVVGEGHNFKTVKPLKLITKLVQIWCPPDGLVLDPFAGSGTTGSAVLALNAVGGCTRRFALIEQGCPERGDSYARSLTADRLQRMISGCWAVGKREPLGGGFAFKVLDRRKVDAPALLSMEREEMTDTVIASHFDATRRRGLGLCRLPVEEYQYLVAKNTDEEGFFLVWGGADANTDFTEDVYEAIAEEAERARLKPIYHVYARLYLFQSTSVIFYQIPDRILRDFGLDLRGEPFSDD